MTTEIDPEVEKINNMTQIEMARIWRFSPSGCIYFRADLPYYDIFKARFNELGGMTPEISKRLGWDD
jgi:hypothetical protein